MECEAATDHLLRDRLAHDLLSLNHEVPALEASYASLQNCLADLLSDAVRQSGLKATPADVARTLMSALRGFKLVASDGRDLRRLMAMQVSLIVAALGQAVRGRVPAARKKRSED